MSKKKMDLLELDKHPTWITQENIEKMKITAFREIVCFFVINTPDKSVSARGKEIHEYGFANEDDLFEELISDTTYLKRTVGIEKSDIEAAGLIDFPPKTVLDESVCFVTSKDKPVTSLFICIRHSLAHGRFNISGPEKMPYLVMESINTNDNCTARIVLKMSTLRRWIKRFEE